MRFVLLSLVGMTLAACAPETATRPVAEGARSSSTASSTVSSSSVVAAAAPRSSPAAMPATSSVERHAKEPRPNAVALDVPFSPQAPFAVWDELHEEACEEMSLIMVHHFLEGTPLTRDDAEGELLALSAWLERNDLPHDINIATLARVAEQYYGYQSTVLTGDAVTQGAMQDALVDGTPVIIPAQGQQLGNPYFSGDGPPYHMLVITGYASDVFITNDPGTKRGEGYRYATQTLLDAIHDWNGNKATVADAPKAMLLLHR